jgi:hypothetical protein
MSHGLAVVAVQHAPSAIMPIGDHESQVAVKRHMGGGRGGGRGGQAACGGVGDCSSPLTLNTASIHQLLGVAVDQSR